MKSRIRAISVVAGAIVCFTAVPAWAQSALIKRLDVNGDGKVSRDELPEGSSQRGMFDRLVTQYKLDPSKTYTLKELEDASGLGGASGSGSSGDSRSGGSSRSNDSRGGGSGSSGGPPRFGDSRRGFGGSGGSSRGFGGGGTGSRSTRTPSDGRPYRALEELPGEYRSYDKDGDGQVGLYEWPKDRIRDFIALDKNDDGFLTIIELKKPTSSNAERDRASEKEKESEPKPAEPAGENS
jgi:hypothetical protein